MINCRKRVENWAKRRIFARVIKYVGNNLKKKQYVADKKD